MSIATHLRLELSLGLQRVPDYPQAAVSLSEVQRGLQIFFHALTGSCRHEITTVTDDAGPGRFKRRVLAQRHWQELAWQNPDQAHLPARISRFPSRALNRDLYYWLAAYLAFEKSVPSMAALSPGLAHLLGGILAQRARRHRLLLVLTDGRPYDPADRYQGRYALEDTRRALLDLRTSGVFPFGFTIDRKGQEYLPHLFGIGRYFVLSKVAALPEALPRIYARLTGLGK